MTALYQIQEAVRQRVEEISSTHGSVWPCRKGCDECCRRLASAPRVTQAEWRVIATAVDALPAGTVNGVRQRIRDSASSEAPAVCPLLDTDSGTCLVYEARPVVCRAYGFYAERQYVLGCRRIESVGQEAPDVVWGNHAALEERLRMLGPSAELSFWLASGQA